MHPWILNSKLFVNFDLNTGTKNGDLRWFINYSIKKVQEFSRQLASKCSFCFFPLGNLMRICFNFRSLWQSLLNHWFSLLVLLKRMFFLKQAYDQWRRYQLPAMEPNFWRKISKTLCMPSISAKLHCNNL